MTMQLTRLSNMRPGRPRRVLLVEDDYELRRMVASVLRYDGYEVTELVNGDELLNYMMNKGLPGLAYDEPDIILSDVCMPGRTGLAALEQLRGASVRAPVVLMTAYPEQCTQERANELGAVTVLEKPFDLDDLRMIVMNLAPRSAKPNAAGPKN